VAASAEYASWKAGCNFGVEEKVDLCRRRGVVSTEMTMVSLCQLPLGGVSIWKDEGVYNGVVTGVYMRGMTVELDEKVWLLVTNPKIAPPLSVRVGAIVSSLVTVSFQVVI